MIKLAGQYGDVMIFVHKVECLKHLHENKQTAVIMDSGQTIIVNMSLEATLEALQQPLKDMLREIAGEGVRLNG